MPQGKLQDGDLSFFSGQFSDRDPSSLVPGQYARGMNVVNRGGVLQCRPGYRCLLVLPDGNLQGFAVFRPKQGMELLVFAVDGLLYTSEAPFETLTQLQGVRLSATAPIVYFKQVEKTNQTNLDGSITFIDPKTLMVFQDGGLTAPIVFDGQKAEHQRGAGKIPLGGPMEWVGDRLWVARGASLYASDVSQPDSFTETIYVAGAAGSFNFPAPITALTKTLTSDFANLLIFTRSNTHLIQASIRDRASWAATPNFQKELFSNLGCVAHRSIQAHYGLLWWYAEHGLVSLDAAATGYVSSSLPYQDSPMLDSKSRLSQDLSGVACISHENYFLVSVPFCDTFNRHTWCLDQTVVQNEPSPAWNSFWTGTRPVEWLSGEFAGLTRCLYISADFDGKNRLWEAFTPDRLDNGCPITWWAELRAYNFSLPGKFKEFRYADIFLTELAGVIDVAAFWAGPRQGRYKRIMTKRIQAQTDLFRVGQEITPDTTLSNFKKQSRPLRTQDGKAIVTDEPLSSCGVESKNLDSIDESFQLLVVASGPGAVRGAVLYAEPPKNTDDAGGCEDDETEENFVRYDGAGSDTGSLDAALEEFENNPLVIFTAVKTVTLTQDGFTEIGVGNGSSIVSQQDADKIATAMANRLAAEALKREVLQIVSQGDAANE